MTTSDKVTIASVAAAIRKARIEKLRQDLQRHKEAIVEIERALESEFNCKHKWSPAVRDDLVTPAFHLAGDPPGTMGVDRQLPCDVPEERVIRWRRQCETCGSVEYTERFVEHIDRKPAF